MSQATVIRDFMVALGFDVDNAGLSKMRGAMDGVELKAKTLTAALGAMAVGAIIAVRQTASELDKLYFSSQRIGASAANINAFGNAISQMGGNAESAIGTLESISEKMRNSPGYEGMLGGLGVSTKDANGVMRDRVDVMKDLSGVLSKMPAYQANAYANSLGIDQNTLMAMRDGKFVSNMEKYQKIQKELGMDDDLTKSGNEFMTEYRDLTMITKTGFQVIVMQAGKALIPILRLLNTMIQAGIHAFSQLNPQIKEGLAIGLRFGMLTIVLGGFIKTFGLLFKFIPMLKSLIGLVKILRLAFLASPIGIILALVAAIGLLWDDYRTWKNGGKSLIDWSKWSKEIDFVVGKIKELMEWIDNLIGKVTDGIFGEGTYEGATNWIQDHVINPVKGWFGGEESSVEATDINKTELGRKSAEGIAKIADSNTEAAQKQNVAANAVLAATQNIIGVAKVLDGGVRDGVKIATHESKKVVRLIKTEGTKRIYQMADGSTETRTGGTVAWRNNNPGNLKFEFKGSADKTVKTKRSKQKALSDAQKRYAGVVALDQWGNAIFETMEAGAVAKAKLLKSRHSDKTYQQMLRKYAVNDYSGKTNYARYEKTIRDTAKSMGVSLEGKAIGEMSDKEFQALAAGMVKAEGVKQGKIDRVSTTPKVIPKNRDELAKFAQNAGVPNNNPHKSQVSNSSRMTASNVTINQEYKTEMILNGVSNPQASADAVKRTHENGNILMARNAKTVLV